MASPQRVNVLLSRARNGLIIFGNPDTFMNSRKGKEVWVPLMDQMSKSGHVYDGLPVVCQQHADKVALLTESVHFDSLCPDGGCAEPWSVCPFHTRTMANQGSGVILNCGVHTCPQRCHRLPDHSKMNCMAIIAWTCSKSHKMSRKCYDKVSTICRKCEAEARAQEKKRQRDHKLDQERQAKQQAYAARLAEVEDEIEHEKRLQKDRADDQDRKNALAQKQADLEKLKKKMQNTPKTSASQVSPKKKPSASSAETSTPQGKSPVSEESKAPPKADGPGVTETTTEQDDAESDWDDSKAKEDWNWQKEYDGARNEALDSLVSMIGLWRYVCSNISNANTY